MQLFPTCTAEIYSTTKWTDKQKTNKRTKNAALSNLHCRSLFRRTAPWVVLLPPVQERPSPWTDCINAWIWYALYVLHTIEMMKGNESDLLQVPWPTVQDACPPIHPSWTKQCRKNGQKRPRLSKKKIAEKAELRLPPCNGGYKGAGLGICRRRTIPPHAEGGLVQT